jgi:hypothetical protein
MAEENQENLCRIGRSQDLPATWCLLASSPVFEDYRDIPWGSTKYFVLG